jgi:small subunit ribosomal protein S4
MKKSRKKYERPRRPWDKERMEKENELLKGFGLRTKKEIWMTEALLRKYRRMARNLAAKRDKESERILMEKLRKNGILGEESALDAVLVLNIGNFLERRLQTLIQRKGLTNSLKQARQLIVHGHVRVNGKKIVYPGYMVSKDEENKIEVDVNIQKPKVTVSEG